MSRRKEYLKCPKGIETALVTQGSFVFKTVASVNSYYINVLDIPTYNNLKDRLNSEHGIIECSLFPSVPKVSQTIII